MATVLLNRSDTFPVGTTVGVYPYGAQNDDQPPRAASIATAVVASDGSLTVTSGSLSSLTRYVCGAQVGSTWRYLVARSTLDTFDKGSATGTATTTSGSAALSSVSATTGAFAIGQRVTGPGIPPGTFLIGGSGGAWTMSAAATASASGVSIEAHGARVPVAVLGAAVLPQTQGSRWRARVMQRRSAIGTS